MLIKIRNWYTDEVIFSLDVENNSIRRTVEEAVRQGVSLSYAGLSYVDLSNTNLEGAAIDNADLHNTNLSGAYLCNADLNGAYLRSSKLTGANLNYARLIGANFDSADLRDACLSGADIHCANLSCANLNGANFDSAKYDNAYFCSAENVPDLPMVCPREGSFIGWKIIWKYNEDYKGDFIVKLEIPEDAKRSSATSNKCRCSKAKVLEIKSIDTDECVDVITNTNVVECVYNVGEYVYPDSFDCNRWNECSNGIHFFMTEQEARHY